MTRDSTGPDYESRRLGADHGRAERWERFVTDHDLATPYHTLAWKRAVERAFGYDPEYRLVVDDRDTLVAVVPGFRTTELVGHTVVNPFCEYGYPLVADDADSETVLRAVEAASAGGTTILKACPVSTVTGYQEAGYGGIQTGVTHRVPTELDFESLRADILADSLRRRDRLAREDGMTVETDADLADYYDRYCETMRRLGSPQFPPSFFPALQEEFGDSFHYRAARADGTLVGGVIGLSAGDTRCLLSNAYKRRETQASPNPMLYLSVLADACDGDTAVVDFGRTEPGSGVDEFKSLFDGRVYPLVSFVTPPRHVGRASVSGYKRLAPLARLASPVITHPALGPRLKRRIHE